MSQQFCLDSVGEYGCYWGEISEPESFIEHQAALDATVFRAESTDSEIVLELEAGQLRIRRAL